jgi:hypothetical protein
VKSDQRVTARLVAHLAEVDERRLHLKAACSSLFDYCVTRLGLSEDAACRRIEVARLARRFPLLFALLERGELTLSVAAKLKPHLSEENHVQLLEAVRGKSVGQALKQLAELFPQPDVAAAIRKLPAPAKRPSAPAHPREEAPLLGRAPENAAGAEPPPSAPATARVAPPPAAPRRDSILEPLSPERYRVQFTASSELKRKLELARDLLRHAEPSGDLAAVVERAVDVLLTELMKRRFGGANKTRKARNARPERVTNATRRQVLERDGLRCAFVDEQGRRCPSRAFLEHDHVDPRGRGGSSETHNVRILCRAHNQLAAELAYGRKHIEAAIEQRRTRAVSPSRGAGFGPGS